MAEIDFKEKFKQQTSEIQSLRKYEEKVIQKKLIKCLSD